MPCWRCGARETDPVRGPSPWKRGVRGGSHVLVCPDCQRGRDWTADLDHCPSCASWRLVRQLGQISCRQCAHTLGPDDQKPPGPTRPEALAPSGSSSGSASGSSSGSASGLSEEVTEALRRLWARPPGR